MASSASRGKPEKLSIPLVANVVPIDDMETKYDSMLAAVITVKRPALGTYSALGQVRLGKVSMDNGLGTQRPGYLIVGFDDTRRFMLMIPVGTRLPNSIKINYGDDGKVTVNLHKVFAEVSRLVPKGMREHYKLEYSPDKLTISGVVGWGLYSPLDEVSSSPIQTGKKQVGYTPPAAAPASTSEGDQ